MKITIYIQLKFILFNYDYSVLIILIYYLLFIHYLFFINYSLFITIIFQILYYFIYVYYNNIPLYIITKII